MTNRPVSPPCPHMRAEEVESSYWKKLGRKVVFAWLCPECGTQLPAGFVPPRNVCCGTRAVDGHLRSCFNWGREIDVPPFPAAPTPPAGPARAPAYRPPPRRIPAALYPLPVGLILGAVLAVALRPHGPEAYNPADAQVCQTWFTQGASVPDGDGVSYIGDYEDPGYAKLTAAENALDPLLTDSVNGGLAGGLQQWEADMESSYIIQHGNWGFENIGSDKAAISGWCKSNRYGP